VHSNCFEETTLEDVIDWNSGERDKTQLYFLLRNQQKTYQAGATHYSNSNYLLKMKINVYFVISL